MHSPSRRSLLLAASLLALLALAPHSARAGERPTVVVGSVHEVNEKDGGPATVAALAALGVTAGASAELSFVINEDAPGQPAQFSPATEYQFGILDLRIRIGEYEAWLAPPPGFEAINFVHVFDDVVVGDYVTDSYTMTCLGQDTDAILAGTKHVTLNVIFHDIVGTASSDEDIVQDVTAYTATAIATVSTSLGSIQIWFPTSGGGTGPGSSQLARHGQLKAAAKLAGKLHGGLAKLAAKPPEADPLGVLHEQLLLDTGESFGQQFLAAIAKANKKGGFAPLPAAAEPTVTEFLVTGLDGQADEIKSKMDTENVHDRKLRAKLLKASAAKARKDFLAHAAYAKKPVSAKLQNALVNSRAKLIKTAGKALEQAAKKGVVYGGPGAEAVCTSIEELVTTFDEMTQGL